MRYVNMLVPVLAFAALSACGSPLELIKPSSSTSSQAAAVSGAQTPGSISTPAATPVPSGQSSDPHFPQAIDVRTAPGFAHIFVGTGKNMCQDVNDEIMEPNQAQIHILLGVLDDSNRQAPIKPGVYIPQQMGFQDAPEGNLATVSYVNRDANCAGVAYGFPMGAIDSITVASIDANGITGSYELVGDNNQRSTVSFNTIACASSSSPYEYGGIGDNVGSACQSYNNLTNAAAGDGNYTQSIDVRGNVMDIFVGSNAYMCGALNDDFLLGSTTQMHIQLGQWGADNALIPGNVTQGTYTTLAKGATPTGLGDFAYVSLNVSDATCNATTGSGFAEAGGNIVLDKIDSNAVMGSYDVTIAGTGRHITGTFHTTHCDSQVVPTTYSVVGAGSTKCD